MARFPCSEITDPNERRLTMLMRFDPFRELDRLTDAVWGNSGRRRGASVMAMDAYRGGDRFVVQFDLPGVPRAENAAGGPRPHP